MSEKLLISVLTIAVIIGFYPLGKWSVGEWRLDLTFGQILVDTTIGCVFTMMAGAGLFIVGYSSEEW